MPLGPGFDPPRDLTAQTRLQRRLAVTSNEVARLGRGAPEPIHYIGNTANDPITVSFKNSWIHLDASSATPNFSSAAFRNCGFYRDRGRVYLTGIAANGTLNTVGFTVPEGYRPSTNGLIIATIANGAMGYVNVFTNGDVAFGGSNVWFALDGVSYRV